MSEFQSIASILMALFIGYVIGRASNKTERPSQHEITQEEQARLTSGATDSNPYDDVHWDVLAAIKSGQTIQAVKLYRQHHGSSLKEAKQAIDAIIRNL